jgi:hypothetical protein
MWRKKQGETSETETKPEEKANARGALSTNKMCCNEPLVNGYCYGNWVNCSRVSSIEGKSNAKGIVESTYYNNSSIPPNQVSCPEGCNKVWITDSKTPANSHWGCDCGGDGIKPVTILL